MEKLTSLSEIIKESIGRVLKNDLLGFLVKSRLLVIMVGILFTIPIMIPIFTMMGKTNNMYESPRGGSGSLNRVAPLDMDYNYEGNMMLDDDSNSDFGRPAPKNLMAPPTPDITDVMPGAFEVVMLIVGGLLLAFYGIAALNMHTLVTIKLAEGVTEPIKPLFVLSFKRTAVMLAHMIIKGFILFFGFLLLIVPGVYLSVKFMFSEMALLNENLGPIAALKRSSQLTAGYKLALYIKMIGLFGIQLLLLIPLIIFIVLFGNKSMGPVLLEMYGVVMSLIFVFYYLELAKIKGTNGQQTVSMPQPMPEPITGTTTPEAGVPNVDTDNLGESQSSPLV